MSTTFPAGLDFKFLSEDSVDMELCRRYWAVRPEDGSWAYLVAEIGEHFNVPVSRVAGLVAERCQAFFADESCDTCGNANPVMSRADYTTRKGYRRWPGPKGSTCRRCQEAKRLEMQRAAETSRADLVARIQKSLEDSRATFPWMPPRLLAFEDAVSLLSLFRAGGSDDLSFVVPHGAFSVSLSPTPDLDRRILDRLYRRHVIEIHPGSSHDAVVADTPERFSFYPFKVHWILPVPADGPSPALYLEQLETLLKSREEWPNDWEEDAGALHREIALEECQEYLRLCLQEHGFNPKPSEKLSLVLRSILRQFSIGQTYNFIWRAARDAAAFYVREQTARAHAVNIVPGHLQRQAERAVAERWVVKPYRRDRRAPESQVSHVLFTLALQLSDGGFNAVPPAPNDDDDDSSGGKSGGD